MELRKTVMLFEDVAAELVVEVGESLVIWLKSSRGSIVVRGMFVAGPCFIIKILDIVQTI